MKKISILTIICALGVYSANADTVTVSETVKTVAVPMNVNNNNNGNVYTASAVQNMADNTPVIIVGYITQNPSDQMYVFQDSTGSVMLSIDDATWGGISVTPDTLVRVYGVVDANSSGMEIDVNSVEII